MKGESRMHDRFSLKEYCFLVDGAKRGAIYNLHSGDIFSINENTLELLKLCEEGVSVQDICKISSFAKNKAVIISCLKNLEENGLGVFLIGLEKIKKINISEPVQKIDFMWLEVTDRCNLKCIHCYHGNLDDDIYFDKGEHENRIRVIKDAYELGCRKIQFIGGEPFLLGNKLTELIYFARKIGCDFVEIFTNGTLLKEKHIDFFKKNNVSIAISLYGSGSQIHNKVTLNSASFDKTINNLKKIKQAGLNVRVGITVMTINQEDIENTIFF